MKNHMGPKADENTTQAKEPLITPRYCLLILVSFLTVGASHAARVFPQTVQTLSSLYLWSAREP